MALGKALTQVPDYFTGLGCGFLPFDSFLLSLLPMMLTPQLIVLRSFCCKGNHSIGDVSMQLGDRL